MMKQKYNLNLTICHFEWINDFAAAKNFALSKATGDWIVFLDADEYFDKKDSKKLRPLIEKLNKDKSMIYVENPLVNIDVNNHNSVISKASQIRIFRRRPDFCFEGAIHEHLWFKGTDNINFFESDLTIIHTGYAPGVVNQKLERNSEILINHQNLIDKDPAYLFYLAWAYYQKKDYEKAEETILETISKMKKEDHYFLLNAYTTAFNIKNSANKPQKENEDLLDDALKAIPNHPDLLAHKLTYLLDKGNFENAEEICNTIFEKSKDKELKTKYASSAETHLPFVHYVLGAIYKTRGNNKDALDEFLTALKSYRYRFDILNDVLILSEGNDKKILKLIDEYYDEENDAEFLEEVFKTRPRDGLYKRFCKSDKASIDYKLASGKIIDAIKIAAKEVEIAKQNDLSNADARQDLKEKMHILAVCFLFLDVTEIAKAENELNLLPPSVISIILRFYGETLPPVEGEKTAYNSLTKKATEYLPKNLRDRFFELKF